MLKFTHNVPSFHCILQTLTNQKTLQEKKLDFRMDQKFVGRWLVFFLQNIENIHINVTHSNMSRHSFLCNKNLLSILIDEPNEDTQSTIRIKPCDGDKSVTRHSEQEIKMHILSCFPLS